MKKLAMLLAILMVFAAAPGYCLVEPVDRVIDYTMESDLRPVEDTGKILDATNKGIDHTYTMVTKPFDPILNPIRKVRDFTLDNTKMIVNKTWDLATLKFMRK